MCHDSKCLLVSLKTLKTFYILSFPISCAKGGGIAETSTEEQITWGGGRFTTESTKYEGGIYIASTVASSCKFWNCQIIADRVNGEEIIGRNGDIEHLRSTLRKAKVFWNTMKPNQLYWISDRTPHEVLPMKADGYRQFVRVVCHEVGVWYEEHSTPNPFGLLPDPKITKIVKGSKFEDFKEVKTELDEIAENDEDE